MWRRDPAVQLMIEALDQYAYRKEWHFLSREERYDLLSKSEWDAVCEQQKECTKDFSYAARNYFWITDNSGKDVLLTLWESQYLILQLYYDLRSQGKPQKVYLVKGRQIGACVSPDTRILTDDLRWVRIDDVRPGQGIVAVDESPPGGQGSGRKLRRAVVEARKDVYEPAFRITMDNGQELIATGDHKFLCRHWSGYRQRGDLPPGRKQTLPGWWKVSDLAPGDEIRHITKPWEEGSYEDGWVGGMVDGEGSLRGKDNHGNRGGCEVVVSQRKNSAYDRVLRYLTDRGYTFRVDHDNRTPEDSGKFGTDPVSRFCVERIADIMRLLGQCRPSRMIDRKWWDGADLPGKRSPGPTQAWRTIVSIEPIGKRRMVDLQTSAKTYIAEGFVSHNSLVIQALVAWRAIFFPNTEAIICSVDQPHSSYLFGLGLHIYDHLPWWLKPEVATREEKSGIWFNRKKAELREIDPGIDSHIYVQWSTQYSGVGQGRKILACHVSEITDWYEPDARKIIEGDLKHAVKDTVEAFAFIETTGKYAGSYAYRLWRNCEKMAEYASWYPLFLPYFFESSRRRVIPNKNWRAQPPEVAMRARVSKEWVKCSHCVRHIGASLHGQARAGTACFFCRKGTWQPLILDDQQLFWKEVERRNAQGSGGDSLKEHLIEVASTAEESWQVEGLAVFGPECQDRVNATILDPEKVPGIKVGYFDTAKAAISGRPRFHGLDGSKPVWNVNAPPHDPDTYRCYLEECSYDHAVDFEQFNVTIWEEPQPGCEYSIGVDIAEGLGQDYSVIFVNKFGKFGPDEQVAILRDNRMEPLDLAYYCNLIGKWYNDALMCIEYNGIGKVCADAVLMVYQYSNIYRWKHLDSVRSVSNKWHWYTKSDTREKLWQTARKWIKSGSWVIRSKNFLHEMQMFQKDEDDSKTAGHIADEHDDELISGMIALYCGHEGEADERGVIHVPLVEEKVDNPRWIMHCNACEYEFGAMNPAAIYRCQRCNSVNLTGKNLESADNRAYISDQDWNRLDIAEAPNFSSLLTTNDL